MRSCFLAATMLFAACLQQEGIDRTQPSLKSGGYEPAAPGDSVCDCKGDGGNGTCSSDCTAITCDPGFADCNGRLDDGCESRLDDPSTCGTCGNNCHECREGAICNAGACEGKARPDDSACRAFNCTAVGVCRSGECMCATDGVDLARLPLPPVTGGPKMPPGGHDLPGDCSFTGGGTATASVMLLLGAVALLFRRRKKI